jgi:hypothetical protein
MVNALLQHDMGINWFDCCMWSWTWSLKINFFEFFLLELITTYKLLSTKMNKLNTLQIVELKRMKVTNKSNMKPPITQQLTLTHVMAWNCNSSCNFEQIKNQDWTDQMSKLVNQLWTWNLINSNLKNL